VDEPGAAHRLDDGADRFAVHLVDPSRKPAQRFDVRRDGELIEVLALLGEQADVELSPTQV
jgi:hypothetical protein